MSEDALMLTARIAGYIVGALIIAARIALRLTWEFFKLMAILVFGFYWGMLSALLGGRGRRRWRVVYRINRDTSVIF